MPREIWLVQISQTVFQNADHLGPVFRYGPNRLSFNTHTALHIIYTPKANIRKSDFYKILISPAGPSILAAIPNDMHARKKRVLSQAFSEKALRSIEEYMLLHSREFCEKLSSSPEPVNMSHWSTYLTGDVLGEVCFGKSFSMLKEKTNRNLMDLITGTARFGLIVSSTASISRAINPKYIKLLEDFKQCIGLLIHHLVRVYDPPPTHAYPKNILLQNAYRPPQIPRMGARPCRRTD